jgi:hypothetical protein
MIDGMVRCRLCRRYLPAKKFKAKSRLCSMCLGKSSNGNVGVSKVGMGGVATFAYGENVNFRGVVCCVKVRKKSKGI